MIMELTVKIFTGHPGMLVGVASAFGANSLKHIRQYVEH